MDGFEFVKKDKEGIKSCTGSSDKGTFGGIKASKVLFYGK
ncbi:hypothetical protein GMSM_24070 [Geomonas sp. Red276]